MPETLAHLKKIIHSLPEKPGVYQYYDENNTILYIGKAKNLKNRVSSYFNKYQFENKKTAVLVNKIREIKFILVETEFDALLLENTLIKEYQPRFNIQLRDDKTYPWIFIKNEHFPRVGYTRNLIKDGTQYFGPYASVRMMKILLGLIKQLYKFRTCNYNLSDENIKAQKFKVCLEYHIGNCKAPCVGKQSKTDYNQAIAEIKEIIKGNIHSVIKHLKKEMNEKAENLEFELAAGFKEKIEILENYQSKSTVVSPTINNVDVFSIIAEEKYAYVNFLKVMNGAIIQSHTIELKKKLDETNAELLETAIVEMRVKFNSESAEICVPIKLDLEIPYAKISIPQRGDKKSLLELSERNARFYMLERRKEQDLVDPNRHANRVLTQLQKDLRLNEMPIHIECFDNSNFQGSYPVAACVVFKNAKPAKKEYRHFNIKTVVGSNDFASMEEVVYRRYSRMLEEGSSLPQLILIDGGKGQLSSALKSLDALGLRGKIAIVGIAKRLEEIFFPGDSIPIYIDKRSESLKLLQQLRNEAHRFGITFHRNKRSKGSMDSELNNIPGVGKASIEKLLEKFKSVKKIKEANLEDLLSILDKKKAASLTEFFAKNKS